jgi:hypothetical protein
MYISNGGFDLKCIIADTINHARKKKLAKNAP